ncbi:MAG: O-acetyltransferase [Arcobacter sp.]|nr:MAG: O-acetyltransferase [Arcobacter sp.]
MAYLTKKELLNIGFKSLGNNVKISNHATFYNCDKIEIGDNSRIDDFCVISGKIKIGNNVHIAPFCLVAGGEKGIIIDDFSGLAYHVQVFTQSDDYSGGSLTNPTIPAKYKKEFKKEIFIGKHSIIGAGSIVMPGVTISVGTSIGAASLIRRNTKEWSIYLGNPAKKIKDRKKDLLELEKLYFDELDF